MSEKTLIKREDAILQAVNGFNASEGEYIQFLVKNKENKYATILGLDNQETSWIFKKLVNGEWVEIPESELPKSCKITLPETKTQEEKEPVKALPSIRQSIDKLEELTVKLDMVSSLINILDKANEDYDIALVLRDVNNRLSGLQSELGGITTNLIQGCQDKEQLALNLA